MRYNLDVRRILLLSLLGMVALLPSGLQAQRGGRAAMGGGFRAAPRSAAMGRMPGNRGAGFAPGRFGRPFIGNRFGYRRRFFNNYGCFGNAYCSGYYYPYSGLWDFWPDEYEEYPQQQSYTEVQQPYDDSALRDEVDRLTYEVERLRADQARPAQPTPRPTAEQPSPTVLVFRDGHRDEVQNYGIVGQTLWVFTERHSRKYPLSDLDLPATETANEQRGIDFVVPASPQPEKPVGPSTPGPHRPS